MFKMKIRMLLILPCLLKRQCWHFASVVDVERLFHQCFESLKRECETCKHLEYCLYGLNAHSINLKIIVVHEVKCKSVS